MSARLPLLLLAAAMLVACETEETLPRRRAVRTEGITASPIHETLGSDATGVPFLTISGSNQPNEPAKVYTIVDGIKEATNPGQGATTAPATEPAGTQPAVGNPSSVGDDAWTRPLPKK